MRKQFTFAVASVLAICLLTACASKSDKPFISNNSRPTDKNPQETQDINNTHITASDTSPIESAKYAEVIPFIYDQVGPFSEGLAWVMSGGKWGIIDKSGNEVVRCVLDYKLVEPFSDGMSRVREDRGYGFVDRMGNVVVPPGTYQRMNSSLGIGSFSDGLASAYSLDEEGWGYIDTAGNMVIPFIYNTAYAFSNGFAQVGYRPPDNPNTFIVLVIDKTGNEIVVISHEENRPYGMPLPPDGDGRSPSCPVRRSFDDLKRVINADGSVGYIDSMGNVVIPFIYEQSAREFSDGLAAISRSNTWGFINQQGNEIIPCQYVWAENFSEGFAMVVYHGKSGFIDKTGNEIIPLIYDDVGSYFSDGLAMVFMEGKGGFIDKSGNEIIPFGTYTLDKEISHFSEGFAAVSQNGKWGFISIR